MWLASACCFLISRHGRWCVLSLGEPFIAAFVVRTIPNCVQRDFGYIADIAVMGEA